MSSQITAAMVKELRTQSGAGMMDCKKALAENDGNIEAAVDWLRTKGLAKAAKKAGRVAAEGLVAAEVSSDPQTDGAVVEVNSETDFVARNEKFQQFVVQLARQALAEKGALDKLQKSSFAGAGHSVTEEVTNMVAAIGENITLRRAAYISVSSGVVVSYVHNAIQPGLGKIAVLVALQSEAKPEELQELGRQLAMHIAATKPESLSIEDLSEDILAREREIVTEQARQSGRPEEIIEKMVAGRLRKFYEEVVLLEQVFVIDGESKIKDVLQKKSKELGKEVTLSSFVRFHLGEGVEREDIDFASEVAATLKN